MSAPIHELIEADCSVLLLRAFLNKQIVAFGEDGLGDHGRCDLAQYYNISDIDVTIDMDADDEPIGIVSFRLDGYDSNRFGHICSDRNFLIRCREMLKAEHIDPNSLSYAILEMQGDDYVTMDIDVKLLLDWA